MNKMDTTTRASCWSVTINNPTMWDEEEINLARQRGWSVEGQLEKGAEGTPHYQLCVKTPQVRFSAIKKAFTRAHIEIARTPTALQRYCRKEKTREGDLPQQQEMYPSLARFWELIYEDLAHPDSGICNRDMLDEDGEFFVDITQRERDRWRENKLLAFDDAVSRLIDRGYIVENLAANNLVRTAFRKYGKSIIQRTHRIVLARQFGTLVTDRQTDSVEIPVVPDINADESSPPQATSGILEGRLGSEGPRHEACTEDQEGRDEDCEVSDRSESGE